MTEPTPLTDAKLIELEMQDLQIGHRLREAAAWAKELERELARLRAICNAMPAAAADGPGISIEDAMEEV